MINLVGKYLGRYRIDEVLGEGGMAMVYKAFDSRLERFVAVKVVMADEEQSEEFIARFEREAKALAKLSHPNIVDIHDFGDQDGMPYLVMEYLPGGTLKQKLGKPFPFVAALRTLIPIASALAYAHKLMIVHRDVKPANVLLTETGQPMLSDFGIAKMLSEGPRASMTGTGVGIGTPDYMAPEQGIGMKIDHRVDIYSLGVVLFELVTGYKPFTAKNPMAVLLKHVSEPFPSARLSVPDLPEDVDRIIFKAVEKKPGDRYQEMGFFQTAMEDLVARAKTVDRAAEPFPEEKQKPVNRKSEPVPVSGVVSSGRRPIILDSSPAVSNLTALPELEKKPPDRLPPPPGVKAGESPIKPAEQKPLAKEQVPAQTPTPFGAAPAVQNGQVSEQAPLNPVPRRKTDATPPTPVPAQKPAISVPADPSLSVSGFSNTAANNCPKCFSQLMPGDTHCRQCGSKVPDELFVKPAPDFNVLKSMPEPDCVKDVKDSFAGGAGVEEEWILAVVSGPLNGTCCKLGALTTVGRNKENEIRLMEINASRHHAQIQRSATGYILTDLNSSNGTYLNGARLTQPTPLKGGDILLIGDTYFNVRAPEKPPSPGPPPAKKPLEPETVRHPKEG